MESDPNLSPWILEGVTAAAKRNPIHLKMKQNVVGKSRNDDIRIVSTVCSRKHGVLHATDMEVIMRDEVESESTVDSSIVLKVSANKRLYLPYSQSLELSSIMSNT